MTAPPWADLLYLNLRWGKDGVRTMNARPLLRTARLYARNRQTTLFGAVA